MLTLILPLGTIVKNDWAVKSEENSEFLFTLIAITITYIKK